LFFGANPALTRLVGPDVLRPLAAEEDLGRALLASLAPDQRAKAVVSEVAPDDILQRNRPRVEPGQPDGLAATGMLPQQRALLEGLVRHYLDRLPAEVAAAEAARALGEAGERLHFAWAGGAEPGLLIEYDNVQDGVNHVHSVWRVPGGDFGQSTAGE
jgi:hypothetical protein